MYGLLNDDEISQLCRDIHGIQLPMIEPYQDFLTRELPGGKKVISFGQSSFGYDMRLGKQLVMPESGHSNESYFIDPKGVYQGSLQSPWHQVHDSWHPFFIPSGHHVLGTTLEYWKIPEDIFVQVIGKSTYARAGLIVNVTPMEPGWEGNLTLELHNATNMPIKIYPGEGIAQAIFIRGEKPRVNYNSRKGKYQGQTEITTPTV